MDKLAEMTQRGFKMLEDGLRKEIKKEVGGLENRIGGLESGMSGLGNRIGGLENRIDKMDGKFNKLLTGQDQILKRLDDLETDKIMDVAAHRRQEDKLENHEERIVIVEEKLEIDSVI